MNMKILQKILVSSLFLFLSICMTMIVGVVIMAFSENLMNQPIYKNIQTFGILLLLLILDLFCIVKIYSTFTNKELEWFNSLCKIIFYAFPNTPIIPDGGNSRVKIKLSDNEYQLYFKISKINHFTKTENPNNYNISYVLRFGENECSFDSTEYDVQNKQYLITLFSRFRLAHEIKLEKIDSNTKTIGFTLDSKYFFPVFFSEFDHTLSADTLKLIEESAKLPLFNVTYNGSFEESVTKHF